MLNLIDLFSGIGGLSNGFIKHGFNIVLANDIDKDISISYKLNHDKTIMINSPIENLIKEIEKENIILNNITGIIGGPPCQGFSAAGKRNRKDFIKDPRNYLFREYFKIIQKYEPQFFIMENVPGLMTMDGGEIFEEIKEIFSEEKNFKYGKYFLSYSIVNALDFGVPQNRKRLILIGSKNKTIDLKESIKQYNKKFNIKTQTVEDAISDLAYLNANEGDTESDYIFEAKTQYQKERRVNSLKLFNHNAFFHQDNIIKRIMKIKQNENFKVLNEDIKSVHSGSYGRLSWDKPATTITTRFDTPSTGRVIHPDLHRVLTAREAARLQSFDDNIRFFGTKSSICRQIGNAVPPLVSFGLAYIIKNELLNN